LTQALIHRQFTMLAAVILQQAETQLAIRADYDTHLRVDLENQCSLDGCP